MVAVDRSLLRRIPLGSATLATLLLVSVLAYAFGVADRNFYWRNFSMLGAERSAMAAQDEITSLYPPGSAATEATAFLAANGARCDRESFYGRDRRVCRFTHDNPLIPLSLVEWRVAMSVDDGGRIAGGYDVQVRFTGL